jgi:hypothetical protein
LPIVVRLLGVENVIEVRFVVAKAMFPIDWTLLGIVTVVIGI